MTYYRNHIEFWDGAMYIVYVAWTEHGPREVSNWLIPGTQLEDE